MAKKNTPIITHTEILCYAIRQIEAEIAGWKGKIENAPAEYREMVEQMVQTNIDRLLPKLDALKGLYRVETGEPYC